MKTAAVAAIAAIANHAIISPSSESNPVNPENRSSSISSSTIALPSLSSLASLASPPILPQVQAYNLVDTAIFAPDYCAARPDTPHNPNEPTMIDTNALDCTKLMEFVYLTRSKVRDEILKERILLLLWK
jgi:hypothetical protein